MNDLKFQVVGVETAIRGLVPLIHFKVQIEAAHETDVFQGLLLNAQIQLQCPQRHYSEEEKERLVELFGRPEQWGRTLRNRLWSHANATVGPFTGRVETVLPVHCTYDLNLAATKYFYALKSGEVSLLFLFSGSGFYLTPEGRLQVGRISWNSECTYRLPVQVWRDLMDKHYPNSAWLSLQREVFDRLYAYRRAHGLATWEQALEQLLPQANEPGAATKPETEHATFAALHEEVAA